MNLNKEYYLLYTFFKNYTTKIGFQKCLTSNRRNFNFTLSNRVVISLEGSVTQHNPFKYLNCCYFSTITDKCWNCGNSISSLFCDNCKVLRRVNKQNNYFELLELDYNYDIKLSELTKNYRKLQSVLHPDKFGNKSKEERDISEEYSSMVNKAYATLNNPVERGLYMLELSGSTIEEDIVQLDPQFLMEIMEKNEELENETDARKISEYNQINKKTINDLIVELSAAFEKRDIAVAKQVLTKLKYFASIDSKIKDMKQKLGLPD